MTSKDENLTKSHVKYLEAQLVQRATQASRYSVRNANQPTQSGLPRADRDAMEEFLSNLPLLLGVLGHRMLDAVAAHPTAVATSVAPSLIYTYAIKGALAKGTTTDEGFVVFKGSTAQVNTTPSLSPGWRAIREELMQTKKLVPSADGTLLQFGSDVLFRSSSAAASVVCGYQINGPASWEAPDGRTLKTIEAAEGKLAQG